MIYIGIDPGTHTGMAVWDSERKQFDQIVTTKIHTALMEVWELAKVQLITVVFEDARQRQYLPRERSESEYRGRLMGAGAAKRDAVIWEDFCKGMNIPYLEIPPRKGMTKWSQDYFKTITGWEGRTSEHSRDAAVLVFGR